MVLVLVYDVYWGTCQGGARSFSSLIWAVLVFAARTCMRFSRGRLQRFLNTVANVSPLQNGPSALQIQTPFAKQIEAPIENRSPTKNRKMHRMNPKFDRYKVKGTSYKVQCRISIRS